MTLLSRVGRLLPVVHPAASAAAAPDVVVSSMVASGMVAPGVAAPGMVATTSATSDGSTNEGLTTSNVAHRRMNDAELGAIYAKHARYVGGVVRRILGVDVDDIVQETFVDALEGLTRLTHAAATRAWLVTVAVRRTRRVLARRRVRMMFTFWASELAPKASDPRDCAAIDDLYDALARIPGDLRIPWVLHRVEHLSLPETAAVCEVSLATIKRRIKDAETRLEKRLERGGTHDHENVADPQGGRGSTR